VSNYQALLELQIMASANNYNRWIWDTIAQHIGNSILEIGSGVGTFTKFLMKYPRVHVTDIADNCIDILHRNFSESKNLNIAKLDITSILDREYWVTQNIDTVICLNVIEHINDDLSALENLRTVICDNAKIIVMVPAFKFAFGTIDRLDGHYRRYSKGDLIAKLKGAGFSPIQIRYFNSIGLIAWFYTNKIARDKHTSLAKVQIYDRYFIPILSWAERFMNPPFGQSIIAIAEKK